MNLSLLLEIIRQRRRTFFLGLFCTVSALGLISFRLAWQEPRLESLRAEWFSKRDASGGVARNPVEVYRQGKADLESVNKHISERKEFVRLLGELYELAGNNRLVLGDMSYKLQMVKDAKNVSLTAYELTMAAGGGYAALKSFLADLERMDEMVVIDGLTVSSGKEEAGQAVAAKIVLTAYFRAEGT